MADVSAHVAPPPPPKTAAAFSKKSEESGGVIAMIVSGRPTVKLERANIRAADGASFIVPLTWIQIAYFAGNFI